ncbi:MAG: hypothetical protein WBG57_13470 [Ornithinimicrobium sp.]
MRANLSTGWTGVALLMLFRDVHELFRPGVIDQMRSGAVNGTQMSEGLLLVAGASVILMVAMSLLVRLVPWGLARWAVLVVAPLTMAGIAAAGLHDADDVLFAVVQALLLLAMMILAWRTASPEQ